MGPALSHLGGHGLTLKLFDVYHLHCSISFTPLCLHHTVFCYEPHGTGIIRPLMAEERIRGGIAMGQKQLTKLRQLLQAPPEGLQGSHLRHSLAKVRLFFLRKIPGFFFNALKCHLFRACGSLFILPRFHASYFFLCCSLCSERCSLIHWLVDSQGKCLPPRRLLPSGSDPLLFGLLQNSPHHIVRQQSSGKKRLLEAQTSYVTLGDRLNLSESPLLRASWGVTESALQHS